MDNKKLGRIVRPSDRVTGDRRDSVIGAGWEFAHVANECPLLGFEFDLTDFRFGSLPGFNCLNSKRVRLRGMAQIFPASIVGAAVKQATNQMDHYELE